MQVKTVPIQSARKTKTKAIKTKNRWRESVKVTKQHKEYSNGESSSAVTSIVGKTSETKAEKVQKKQNVQQTNA